MKCKEATIKIKMKEAGFAPEDVDGVTEVIYHARDIAKVFGRLSL